IGVLRPSARGTMLTVNFKITFVVLLIALACAGLVFAGQSQQNQQANKQQAAPPPAPDNSAVNQVVDKILARETALVSRMRNLHPLVETYLQNLDKDETVTFRPSGDTYFLSKLDLNSVAKEQPMTRKEGFTGKVLGKITQVYSIKYLPGGFAQTLMLNERFDRQNYEFEYVRREFLGEVRTVVFDVKPKKGARGTFIGRIWAEDQDFNIVRINGVYGSSTATKMFFHFDSWREYMGNGG